MTFQSDESQQLALKTWYVLDHELHNDFNHPLMKLVGEIGEFIDGYAKGIYKPEFVEGYEFHRDKALAELGDISYYLRILAYQCELTMGTLKAEWKVLVNGYSGYMKVESILAEMSYAASQIYRVYRKYAGYGISPVEDIQAKLPVIFSGLLLILAEYDTTWDELILMNREKLKDGKHGWEENKI